MRLKDFSLSPSFFEFLFDLIGWFFPVFKQAKEFLSFVFLFLCFAHFHILVIRVYLNVLVRFCVLFSSSNVVVNYINTNVF